jgi:regulator of protease activity HflC (stomatin/prohibitin superfamily)
VSDARSEGNDPGPDPFDGSREPSALGASASLPAESRRGRAKRGGRGERPGARPLRSLVVILVVVVALAAIPLLASGFEKTPKDRVGISYGGGPIEGAQFQKVVEPGSALFFNGFFDQLYLYPADQQNYIVSEARNEGSRPGVDAVVAPSKDRVQIAYQLAVYYRLNTDALRAFHEQFGLKYSAYTNDGWNRLIEDTFRPQLENAVQAETRRHGAAEIYGDADLLLEIQDNIQATFSERLQLAMGGRFFCAPTFQPGGECGDPTFSIKKVKVPESVAAAFETNRTSEIAIQTKANEVEQRKLEAQGIEALGVSGDVYATLKAIEAGGIDFWVLPQDGGVSIQTPGSDASAPADAAPAGGN